MAAFIYPTHACVHACVCACAVPEECTTSGDRHRVIATGFMGQSGQHWAVDGLYVCLLKIQADVNYYRPRGFYRCVSVHRGPCVVAGGDMHGCRGACVVVGGMHGCRGCAWLCGDMHGCGGHAWLQGGMCGIRRDTVNEQAVCILLECILVFY